MTARRPTPPPASGELSRGFTLLEVMVAVAILGLSLTVILSAQAGLYASGGYAQKTSVAVGLARCKMTEIEERLLKLGYPEAEENDEGACCTDDTRQDLRCTWKVQRVELPQPQNVDTVGGKDGGSGGGMGGLAAALGSASAPGGAPGGPGGGLGPLGALAQLSMNPQSIGQAGDGGIAALASGLGGGAAGGTAAIAPLVMALVYPQLKPMLDASIRKVTVKVTWHEGLRSRDIEIVQYVTNPVRGGLLGAAGTPVPGASGLPPGSGAFRAP